MVKLRFYYCQKCKHYHNRDSKIGREHQEFDFKKIPTKKDLDAITESINNLGDFLKNAVMLSLNLKEFLIEFNLPLSYNLHNCYNSLFHAESSFTRFHTEFFKELSTLEE